MKRLLFGILLCLLSGCRQGVDKIPANAIPEEKMVMIMADLQIADALVDNRSAPMTTNVPLTNALYKQILHNYGVQPGQFKLTYKYYENHPELMDQLYVQVITEISKKQAVLTKK